MGGILNTILAAVISLGVMTSPTVIKEKTFYFEFDEQGQEHFIYDEIEFQDSNNTEENIHYILTCLFKNKNNHYTYIPEGVTITNILYINGSLDIEVASNILNYGGTMRESAIIDQILATVFSFEEIEIFTLIVEGDREFLVEGTIINGYTRKKWKERMNLIEQN